MGGERTRFSEFFAKDWETKFSKDLDPKDHAPWSELKEAINPDGDDIGTILREFDDALPDCVIEEIEEFVQGRSSLIDLKLGRGAAGERRCAWIDDRSSTSSTGLREYKDRVTTTTGAYRRLKLGRFDIDGLPDADRRLIHVRFLDPSVISALIETASFREFSLLGDGIWKHLALQTSIRANFTEGFTIFQMEMHIPSLELRTRPVMLEHPSQSDSTYPARQWIDLAFLKIPSKDAQGQVVHGIREAHFSFFVSVSDLRRWVGYSFVDKHLNDEDEELEDDVSPSEGVHKDPISNGELDADIPIWDSREYFLWILQIRIGLALKEWKNLIRKIECAIKRYKHEHSSTSSKDSTHTRRQAEEIKQTFKWTQQTMDLLSQLLEVLSDTIKAWHMFVNGDIGYFFCGQDSTPSTAQSQMRRSISVISGTIVTMEGLKGTLEILHKGCRESREALHLRLSLEANDSVRKNGLLSEFTMSIIAPIMLIIAYYSIPLGSVPFKLDPKYFMAATLIIMVVLRLLFAAICAIPGTWWRWKKGGEWFTSLRLELTNYPRLWMRQRVISDEGVRRQGEGRSVDNV